MLSAKFEGEWVEIGLVTGGNVEACSVVDMSELEVSSRSDSYKYRIII